MGVILEPCLLKVSFTIGLLSRGTVASFLHWGMCTLWGVCSAVMFCNAFLTFPPAVVLMLQLSCSPVGNQNFQKKRKENITNEPMPQSVVSHGKFKVKVPEAHCDSPTSPPPPSPCLYSLRSSSFWPSLARSGELELTPTRKVSAITWGYFGRSNRCHEILSLCTDTVLSGYSDTLWNLNFSRTMAGITKWFWVIIEPS